MSIDLEPVASASANRSDSQCLLSADGYSYYALDLAHVDDPTSHPVVRCCEHMEAASWNPQANFAQYIANCSFLLYAVHEGDGATAAFIALTVWQEGDRAVVVGEEAMVHPDHRRAGLSSKTGWLAIQGLVAFLGRNGLSHAYGVVLTCSPVLMDMLWRYRAALAPTSFDAHDALEPVARDYLERFGYRPLDQDVPWFVEGAFPGCTKQPRGREEFPAVDALLPPNFDYNTRGDSLLFVCDVKVETVAAFAKMMLRQWCDAEQITRIDLAPGRTGI